MQEKKVSIIVPVYNIAKWLDECVASLVAQSYHNLEILLIDDGSTDGSSALCNTWSQTDERVITIHKKNGGAASARNVGMDAATGEYICFVDSDDVVDVRYVEHLLQTLLNNDADAAVCGFDFWNAEGFETQKSSTIPGTYSGQMYMLQFLEDWSCSLLWNKIFRCELVGNVRMEEGHRIDDEYFTYQVFLNCNRVAVIGECLYHYRLRASSAVQDLESVQEKVMLDRVGYIIARCQQIQRLMPEIAEPFFRDAVDTITRYWLHSKGMFEAQRQIRKWVIKNLWRLMTSTFSWKQKAGYIYTLFVKEPQVFAEANTIGRNDKQLFE